jgi:hypothetical protein
MHGVVIENFSFALTYFMAFCSVPQPCRCKAAALRQISAVIALFNTIG